MIYTIPQDDEIDLIPAGTYRSIFIKCEPKVGKYGEFIHVEWEIGDPAVFRGRKIFESFNINTENPEYRKYATQAFGRFCRQISGLISGSEFIADKYYMKQYDITIDHKNSKNGSKFVRVVDRKPIDHGDSIIRHRSVVPPQKIYEKVSNDELNDSMPF